jgi:hypothetical protein
MKPVNDIDKKGAFDLAMEDIQERELLNSRITCLREFVYGNWTEYAAFP